MADKRVDLSTYGIKSLSDEPNLSSYGIKPYPAADELANLAAQQGAQPATGRTPQIQEEFSNPTAMPGFDAIPKDEKLQRIGLSQFDPANQTSTGSMVPPGAYESDATRMAASIAPTLAQPELSLGEGMLSRYALNPLLNMAGRIGTGTASNLAYQSPELKSGQDWKQAAKSDLGLNALLEAGTMPYRAGSHFGEMTNPQRFANNTLQQIGDEYKASKELQRSYYKPVFDKYGETKVTENALTDLAYDKSVVKRFTPEIKKSYDQLLENPTLNNLHSFNAQVGRDYRRIATNPGKINTAQTLNAVNKDAKEKIVNFLGRDEKALENYNMGSTITKNHVAPFESTPTLEKMAKGVKTDMTPKQVKAAIKKGREKTVGVDNQGNPLLAVHDAHPLTGHMDNMSNALNIADFVKQSIPQTLSGFMPALGKMASSDIGKNIFGHTAPWWYGIGRGAISAQSQNK